MAGFEDVVVSDPWLQNQFTQVELRSLKSQFLASGGGRGSLTLRDLSATMSRRKIASDCLTEDERASFLRESYPDLDHHVEFELFLRISWLEKFVQKGTEITAPVPMAPPGTTGMGGFERPSSRGNTLRSDASAALNIGVLHLVPTLEEFPLLADPKMYEPNTIDLLDHGELEYWFTVLSEHLPDLVDKISCSNP